MNLLFFIQKTIHRKLLEEELKKIAPHIHGKVLDIGSKDARYSGWFGAQVVSVDVVPNPKKGVFKGDIYDLNFSPNTFDAILAMEVFQYLENPKKAISEIHRVLKLDGVLVLSCPLVYRFHDDLVRYTKNYWEKLLSNFSKVEFVYIGNFYTIILDVIRDKVVKFPNRFLRYIFYLPFLLATFLIPFFQKLSRDKNFVSGYLILIRK